jgi:hypothetical protein
MIGGFGCGYSDVQLRNRVTLGVMIGSLRLLEGFRLDKGRSAAAGINYGGSQRTG